MKTIANKTLLSLQETNQLYVFLKNYKNLLKMRAKDLLPCPSLDKYIEELKHSTNEIIDFLNK